MHKQIARAKDASLNKTRKWIKIIRMIRKLVKEGRKEDIINHAMINRINCLRNNDVHMKYDFIVNAPHAITHDK